MQFMGEREIQIIASTLKFCLQNRFKQISSPANSK